MREEKTEIQMCLARTRTDGVRSEALGLRGPIACKGFALFVSLFSMFLFASMVRGRLYVHLPAAILACYWPTHRMYGQCTLGISWEAPDRPAADLQQTFEERVQQHKFSGLEYIIARAALRLLHKFGDSLVKVVHAMWCAFTPPVHCLAARDTHICRR